LKNPITKKKNNWAGGALNVKALSSNSNTAKKRKKEI
jgi:hypothetical protein